MLNSSGGGGSTGAGGSIGGIGVGSIGGVGGTGGGVSGIGSIGVGASSCVHPIFLCFRLFSRSKNIKYIKRQTNNNL